AYIVGLILIVLLDVYAIMVELWKLFFTLTTLLVLIHLAAFVVYKRLKAKKTKKVSKPIKKTKKVNPNFMEKLKLNKNTFYFVAFLAIVIALFYLFVLEKWVWFFSLLAVLVVLQTMLFLNRKKIVHKVSKKVVVKKTKKKTTSKKIETDFDKLYNMIQEKGEVTLKDVQKEFNISAEKAEEWARLLENYNLIEIVVPAFGDVKLKVKQDGK
ncbi:hypothetical protein D6777_02470, partial [Candidatus Woesearchaeota archaeon]